ncbi:hypothetical protein BH10BAC5_BH10BAC5_21920 [soil metagenome]
MSKISSNDPPDSKPVQNKDSVEKSIDEPAPKSALPTSRFSNTTKVVIASTVMFSFISYWRAAGLVISDLGSTAYYIGGIAEQFVGKVAPYFILAVMFFSLAVRAVYIESCGMFTRGGVYRVVKSALGGFFGKISVSALVFDYVLTGPISAVSAGQYLYGLLHDSFALASMNFAIDRNLFSIFIAVVITIFFWWENTKGIEESSNKAFKIFMITIVMAVIVIGWSIFTLIKLDVNVMSLMPPLKIDLKPEAYGWLEHMDWIKTIGFFSIIIAFGHSLLALSGEESMAQIYRELESPKLKNYKKAAVIIFIFTVILTPFVSFFAVMLIPDDVRPQYLDNLLGGICMFLYGPLWAKLIVQAFVVIVGVLLLSGAVNTSMIGANGVLNRVAEDRVLTDWFRKPHKKFGTSFRVLNLVVILQLVVVILSRGDILVLGEAYAFGVIWSMTFNAFSMLMLRFKDKRPREWRVPINVKIGRIELPIGLFSVFMMLLAVAIINLFTKPVATVSGLSFTFIFFLIFTVSEQINKKKIMKETQMSEEDYDRDDSHKILEHFNIDADDAITPEAIGSELSKRIVVAVRDPNNLQHLVKTLKDTNTDETDIVVIIARVFQDKLNVLVKQDLEDFERELFSAIVNVAENIGKPVIPLVIPTNDAFYAILTVAYELNASEIILGLSSTKPPEVQVTQLAVLWGRVDEKGTRNLIVKIIYDNKEYRADL